MDRGNPFLSPPVSERGMAADAMGKGGTPPDFMAQPQAVPWNADPQAVPRVPGDWSPVDATEALMREGYLGHQFLDSPPDFEGGPGDKNPGSPGWM